MRIIQNKKKWLSIIMVLAISLTMVGINTCFAYANNNSIKVRFTSPTSRQVFALGSRIEISGTAQGLAEVSVTVRSEEGSLVFTAQPQVDDGIFTSSFTLNSDAPEGEYTISLGGVDLPAVKKRIFLVNYTDVVVNLSEPSDGADYEAGDVVEISGSAEDVERLAISVRNSENGRVYAAQPLVQNHIFSCGFTLPNDAIIGEYTVYITGYGMTHPVTRSFMVNKSSKPSPGPDGGDILTIKGDGVSKSVSYSLEELQDMEQIRKVFSATSDRPHDLDVAVEGVPLRTLLDKAGIDWDEAQLITFKATDTFTAEFTIDELFGQTRYIFPEKNVVEPIIALLRKEGSSDYDEMSDNEIPVMVYGQRAKTEQTLLYFAKKVKTISVSTDTPDKWDSPTAVIITPDSEIKVATQGGSVPSGSLIYLEHNSAVPKIYYTTDGSAPDMDSDIFNLHGCGFEVGIEEPIKITKETTVKAIAIGLGEYNSDIMSLTFTADGTASVVNPPLVEKLVDENNIKSELLSLENGRTGAKLTLQPGTLSDIESGVQGSRLTISSIDDVDELRTEIPADVLQKAKEKGMLMGIDSQVGNYTLPLDTINLDEAADGLGVKAETLSLNIKISKASEETRKKLAAQVREGQQMLADPIEFTVEVIAPSGEKLEYKFFGGTYVERELLLDTSINTRQSVGAVWDETQGKFLPVPTLFETRDGKEYAVILSRSNSMYTVLQSNKTFTDIQDSWAKSDIELLASKMLISGKSETAYEPNSSITRAEFATLLVRALGLKEGVLKEGQFKDVDVNDWYAGSVATAVAENIITGYEGKLFKPNNNITRAEIAVMIVRAASVAGMETSLSANQQEGQLAGFGDRQAIYSWAEADVALAARAGIITGMPNGDFSPRTNADRAQSAVVLKRFLVYTNFIDLD